MKMRWRSVLFRAIITDYNFLKIENISIFFKRDLINRISNESARAIKHFNDLYRREIPLKNWVFVILTLLIVFFLYKRAVNFSFIKDYLNLSYSDFRVGLAPVKCLYWMSTVPATVFAGVFAICVTSATCWNAPKWASWSTPRSFTTASPSVPRMYMVTGKSVFYFNSCLSYYSSHRLLKPPWNRAVLVSLTDWFY